MSHNDREFIVKLILIISGILCVCAGHASWGIAIVGLTLMCFD